MVKIGSKCFKHGHYAPLFFPVRCPYHDPAQTTPRVATLAILALRAGVLILFPRPRCRSRIFSSSPPRHLLCALAGRLLCTPRASLAAARHPPGCAHAAPASLAHAMRCSPCLPALSHGRRGHGPSSPPSHAMAAAPPSSLRSPHLHPLPDQADPPIGSPSRR